MLKAAFLVLGLFPSSSQCILPLLSAFVSHVSFPESFAPALPCHGSRRLVRAISVLARACAVGLTASCIDGIIGLLTCRGLTCHGLTCRGSSAAVQAAARRVTRAGTVCKGSALRKDDSNRLRLCQAGSTSNADERSVPRRHICWQSHRMRRQRGNGPMALCPQLEVQLAVCWCDSCVETVGLFLHGWLACAQQPVDSQAVWQDKRPIGVWRMGKTSKRVARQTEL